MNKVLNLRRRTMRISIYLSKKVEKRSRTYTSWGLEKKCRCFRVKWAKFHKKTLYQLLSRLSGTDCVYSIFAPNDQMTKEISTYTSTSLGSNW